MRRPRTLGDLDDLVHETDRTGRHAPLAENLLRAAEAMPRGEGSLRAEVLVAAAEALLLSDQPQRSVAAAEAAVADGGEVRNGARTHLVAAFRGAGRHEDAKETLREVWRARPVNPGPHLFAGEQSEALGEPAEALRWYTRGLSVAEHKVDDEPGELACILMLIARLRLRRELGLPGDDWDGTAADAVLGARRTLAAVEKRPRGVTQVGGREPKTVLHEADETVYIDLVRA